MRKILDEWPPRRWWITGQQLHIWTMKRLLQLVSLAAGNWTGQTGHLWMEPGKGKWLGKGLPSMRVVVIGKSWQGIDRWPFCRRQRVPCLMQRSLVTQASCLLQQPHYSHYAHLSPNKNPGRGNATQPNRRHLSSPSSFPPMPASFLKQTQASTFHYFISSPHLIVKDNRGHGD